jgi:hypothetical protein
MVIVIPVVTVATFAKEFLMCVISLKNMCLKKNEEDQISVNSRALQPKGVM